ncbi:hypothetical protein HY357_04460 [Candidatus Roizmanbacteria bacterium]|nr:hypothetical protein [Candidatus Roizmanbacteria bacterium]
MKDRVHRIDTLWRLASTEYHKLSDTDAHSEEKEDVATKMSAYFFVAHPRDGAISIEEAMRYRNNEDFNSDFGLLNDEPPPETPEG